MIKAVIIEDEAQLRETNRLLLQNNFPNIYIVGEADNVKEAINLIKETQPDIVFLDIELKDGNSFQILQECKPFTFKPIFITAYQQYAVKAIKFSAIDYILKPVNEYEFCDAVSKALDHLKQEEIIVQTDQFQSYYQSSSTLKNIILRTSDALHIIKLEDIFYCKSDNSYTSFFIKDKPEIIVSKSIREYEELLSEYGFIRPHQSYLVNIRFIDKISKTDGGFIVLKNGDDIPMSTRRKQLVIEEMTKYNKIV